MVGQWSGDIQAISIRESSSESLPERTITKYTGFATSKIGKSRDEELDTLGYKQRRGLDCCDASEADVQ